MSLLTDALWSKYQSPFPRTNQQKQSISSVIPAYFVQPKGLIFPSQRKQTAPITSHIFFPFGEGTSEEYTIRNEIMKRVTKAGRNEALSFSSGFSAHTLQELLKKKKNEKESKLTIRSFSTTGGTGEG